MRELLANCHYCMTDILFKPNESTVRCYRCLGWNQRPESKGEALDKLVRADEQRMQCDYEAAAQCYEAVLWEYPHEHAALWGRLLCKYGVEAVEEQRRGQTLRHLVCHRARNTSIRNEGDFKTACEYAEPLVRAQYEKDAAYIDEVQAKIREIAQKKDPYDVFICYKETDLENPDQQTRDSGLARKLCNRFQREGYRVFFAPYTLQDKAGADYEAEIFCAIHTAEVMVVVGLKPEHFTATWPKSEWMRFMELMAEKNILLIPVIGDGMRPEELPIEFRNQFWQASNIDTNPGYEEDLVFQLRKWCPKVSGPNPSGPVAPPEPPPEETAEDLLEMGVLYYNEGPSQNFEKAYDCFQKAKALPEAQLMLGKCFEGGKGIEKDHVQAFLHYKRAAGQGLAEAQCHLGVCYDNGTGITKDEQKAVYWYQQAAVQGFARAQSNLGVCYEVGTGVTKDEQKAVYWYQQAADQGFADAQYNLGVCYEFGKGVTKDVQKAIFWYKKAAEQGDRDAASKLRILEKSSQQKPDDTHPRGFFSRLFS